MRKTLILSQNEYKKWNPKVEEGYKSIIPVMISNTSPSGLVEASSIYNTSYPAWRAFDKITNVHNNGAWVTGGTAPQWISYESTENKCIRKISITGRVDDLIGTQAVKDFSFEGYNESTNSWETIYSKTGETTWSKGETKSYEFENTKKYKKHRLYISATTGSTAFTVTEVDFLEYIIGSDEEWKIENLNNIQSEGMDSLTPLLDRKVTTLEPLKMFSKSEILLNNGKLFAKTIDLNKYMDIKKIEVK